MQTDFFIVHASEDKNDVARPLAEELRLQGFTVWYDEYSLRVGDSLTEQINRGLAQTLYGIVVLSKNFFTKRWAQEELNGLMARATSTFEKLILPVWHNIDKNYLLNHSPILADKVATSTIKGTKHVVEDIIAALQDSKRDSSRLIIGQWRDPNDGDTVYFGDFGRLIFGVYDFGYQSPIGIYRGTFVSNSFHYRWYWLNQNLCGAGKMALEQLERRFTGHWWYNRSTNEEHKVEYQYVGNDFPLWLSPYEFKKLANTHLYQF